jgi:hypothetical protein
VGFTDLLNLEQSNAHCTGNTHETNSGVLSFDSLYWKHP